MEKFAASQGNPPNKTDLYETLLAFIDDALFLFRPQTSESAENKITQDIEMSLNDQAVASDEYFAFQNQHEEENATMDIGVYVKFTHEVFCWIEAKRLPTPKSNSRDEREYVFVDKNRCKGSGGIQRFKEGKYAPKLSHSIMIGYIQDCNPADYWLMKINGWVSELAYTDSFWSNEDCLSKYASNKCSRFLSVHKRKDKPTIALHHYWITLPKTD
jgi:hypothetical protein